MKARNATAILLGVVALALFGGQGTSASGATSDPYASYDQARFRVTIKGYQKMIQQSSHLGESDCDADDFSSGKETLFFRSTKPIVVRAIDVPSYKNPFLVRGTRGPVRLPTRAKITRSFTPRIGPTPQWCGGTGGGQTIPPDCGTRTFSPWRIEVAYDFLKARRITAAEVNLPQLYRNCQGSAGAFPYLLAEKGPRRAPVFAEIPKSEIFDGSIGKIITIARGHYRHKVEGYFYDTTVRWELTFERIRRGR